VGGTTRRVVLRVLADAAPGSVRRAPCALTLTGGTACGVMLAVRAGTEPAGLVAGSGPGD
jgi:hypothetical protein